MDHDQRSPFGMSMFDLMMAAQRNYINFLTRAWAVPMGQFGPLTRGEGQLVRLTENGQDQQVIGIGEESLDVSTRRIVGGTTRIRRVVRRVPIERHVELQDETIVVERRHPNDEPAGDDDFEQREYVVTDIREEPVVEKQARVREQVIVHRHKNRRVETIRDTVRQAHVLVDQPQRMPMVMPAGGPDGHHEHHHNKDENRKKTN